MFALSREKGDYYQPVRAGFAIGQVSFAAHPDAKTTGGTSSAAVAPEGQLWHGKIGLRKIMIEILSDLTISDEETATTTLCNRPRGLGTHRGDAGGRVIVQELVAAAAATPDATESAARPAKVASSAVLAPTKATCTSGES